MKAVLLDFYGTLAETPDWGPSWEQLVAELGYELAPDVRERWWNDGIDGIEHDEHSQSRDHYVAWQQLRVRSMLDECGVPACDQDILIARVHEISGHRRIDAYDEVASVLAELRARGLALAICSNWDWDLLHAIEAAGLDGIVDVTVSSAWVGARKPHQRIFEHTLAELCVAPEDALFVGDTWSCDVEGPRQVGMRAVYLRRPHFGPDKTAPDDVHANHQDVPRATDLSGLVDLARESVRNPPNGRAS
jgi:putative hydrolase of the HAD superfamily